MIEFFLKLIIAYILGSIPSSIIAGKLNGIDIREHGSGNAGGTNTFRVLGWKAGLIVTLFDMFKGYFATVYVVSFSFGFSPLDLSAEVQQICIGFASIIGHIWTVFARFRGGKGVATAAGMMIGLYPEAMGLGILVFALTLYITRYVSLSSMLSASSVPIFLYFSPSLFGKIPSELFLIFSMIIALLIIFTHRSNVLRLINGTENRVGKKKGA